MTTQIERTSVLSGSALKRVISSLRYDQEILIPITLFKQESSLRVIVRYLKDIRGLELKEISELLNRSIKTIWTTYNNSEALKWSTVDAFTTLVPVKIFSNRKLSPLEALVQYLLGSYSLTAIASLLEKDIRTIWTVKSRAEKKLEGENE